MSSEMNVDLLQRAAELANALQANPHAAQLLDALKAEATAAAEAARLRERKIAAEQERIRLDHEAALAAQERAYREAEAKRERDAQARLADVELNRRKEEREAAEAARVAEAALAERRREAELKAQTRVAELEAEGKASAHKAWEEKRRQSELELERIAKAAEAAAEEEKQKRETIELQARRRQQIIEHHDKIERQRNEEERERQRAEEEAKTQRALERVKQEEVIRHQAHLAAEEERRKTAAMIAELDMDKIRVRAEAEASGRVTEALSLRDLRREEAQIAAEGAMRGRVEAVNAAFRNLGNGITTLLDDKRMMFAAVGGATALAAGVYGVREGARVTGRYLDRVLGKPSLVRETSRMAGHFSIRARLGRWFSARRIAAAESQGASNGGQAAALAASLSRSIVMNESLSKRVLTLAESTRNAKLRGAPFRNVLFHGSPGNGKTMVARQLAKQCGLEYAIMTGGDVAPLGPDAVTEIHKMFEWARTSKRGLLLFIDEADAFLGRRSGSSSEDTLNAISAVLHQTGTSSPDFMMVLASNRPETFDEAILSRVDELVAFECPGKDERARIVDLYFHKYITSPPPGRKPRGLLGRLSPSALLARPPPAIAVDDDIGGDDFGRIALATDGFSARELEKLMISVQGSLYGSSSTMSLSRDVLHQIVDDKIAEHALREELIARGASRDAWRSTGQSAASTVAAAAATNAAQ